MSSGKRRIVVPGPRPTAMREIQLIDRIKEMDVLRKAVDRAVHGEGGVIFLYGEAGIGKTRLTRELEAYARSRGMQVLSGRCPALFRMDGVPPYVLWEEVIRDYFEVCTPEELYKVIGFYPAEVCKLVPELSQKLRVIPKSLPISPEHERNRLFEAVSQFVTNISREAPLLVVLDDLQWADQSSLLLLHYLARGVHGESLLLVGAYRDTYVDEKHPLPPVLTELNRERLLQPVSLKRLSFDNVAEMIKRILEQDDIQREFCEMVYEKTRGNPFFVEEVIKSLKEEEVIYREKNKWKIKDVSGIEFPKTVKSVVKRRMSRLDDESQRVLTMASFVGKDFTFGVLRRVTGYEEDKLLETMEKMFKTGLIEVEVIHGEDLCSFADIIVRDVVREEVNPLRRKKLHGVVGCALEKVYSERIDKHFGELALHFLESGDKEKALDYFLKAGEKAAKIYANNEAVSYLQSALRLLEEKEGALREKGRVLKKLGDIKSLVGEHDACMKYWNDALMLWKQAHEKGMTSTLHRKMASVLWREIGDRKKAEEHYAKALKILETEPDTIELVSLYEDTSYMYYRTGNIAKALSWANKAVELAEKLNNLEVIASSYANLGTILIYSGDLARARECLGKALKTALGNGYTETALRAYNNLAGVALTHERRMKLYKEGFQMAKKVGHVRWISWIGINLAAMHNMMGNINKAVLLSKETAALNRKVGNWINLSQSMNILGEAYTILGEWDKTEKCFKEALAISQGLNEFQLIAYSHEGLGLLYLHKKEYVKAREHFEKQCEVHEKAGAKHQQIMASRYLVWTYIELREIEKAKNLLDSLRKYAFELNRKEGMEFPIVWCHILRAMLLRTRRKWKRSIDHFAKALKEYEDQYVKRGMNIYPFARVVLCEYARVYLERDQEGDGEKAYNLLNQALEIFRKIGAKKDTEKVKATIVKTGREIVEPQPVTEIVPPSHTATGYADLDDLLFGGIPRNYAVILTSPSCDERDLLIKRFLETGTKGGEITFHIIAKASGIESLAEKFQSNFYLFICNPEANAIIKNLPNVFKLKGVENLTDINIAIASVLRKLKESSTSRRACIEIISDILLQHHAVSTRRWLNALIPKLKSKGFTTLAVMNPQMHPSEEVQAILDLFEGEISLYERETKKGSEKFLKIKKMYNQKYSKNELRLQEERLQK